MSARPGASVTDGLAAMARRDLRIQLTYKFQFMLLGANVPFVLFTYFFLDRLMGRPSSLEGYSGGYFEFALIGFIVMTFATVALSAFGQSIAAEQHGGTLEVLLVSAEARLATILAGGLLVPAGIAALQAILLFGLGWTISGVGFHVRGVVLALPLLILTIATFGALGIAAAAFIVLTKRGEPLSTLVLEATNLIAGALFPVALLPGPLRVAAHLFPAFYGFEGLREVLLSDAGLREIVGELAALAAFTAALFPLSLRIFRRAVEAARTTGTLGAA